MARNYPQAKQDPLYCFGGLRKLQMCVPQMDDFRALADDLRKRVAHLEAHLTRDPLATPSEQALFSRSPQRQIAIFKVLIAEYDLSHMPGS